MRTSLVTITKEGVVRSFQIRPKPNDIHQLDITSPENGVQIEVREDGKVLWVSVDGIIVLRICQIPYLEVLEGGRRIL